MDAAFVAEGPDLGVRTEAGDEAAPEEADLGSTACVDDGSEAAVASGILVSVGDSLGVCEDGFPAPAVDVIGEPV